MNACGNLKSIDDILTLYRRFIGEGFTKEQAIAMTEVLIEADTRKLIEMVVDTYEDIEKKHPMVNENYEQEKRRIKCKKTYLNKIREIISKDQEHYSHYNEEDVSLTFAQEHLLESYFNAKDKKFQEIFVRRGEGTTTGVLAMMGMFLGIFLVVPTKRAKKNIDQIYFNCFGHPALNILSLDEGGSTILEGPAGSNEAILIIDSSVSDEQYLDFVSLRPKGKVVKVTAMEIHVE